MEPEKLELNDGMKKLEKCSSGSWEFVDNDGKGYYRLYLDNGNMIFYSDRGMYIIPNSEEEAFAYRLLETCIIPFDAMVWGEMTCEEDKSNNAIKLECGWTVGMTKEQIAELAEDCPKSNATLLISKDAAKRLLDRLTAVLSGV